MSYVTGISGNVISAASAGYAPTIGADVSAIASAYVESGVSSKQDTLTFGYDDDKISAINGSAIAGGGGGGGGGSYVETSAQVVDIGTGNTSYPSNSAAFIQGIENENNGSNHIFAQGKGNYIEGMDCLAQGDYNRCEDSYSMAQGWYNTAKRSLSQGTNNYAELYSFAQGNQASATGYSFAQGQEASATSVSFAQGYDVTAGDISFVQGFKASAYATAAVFGKYNKDGNGAGTSGIALAFGDGTSRAGAHNLFEFRKNGTLTIYSSTADTDGLEIVSSIVAISAAATGGGATGDYVEKSATEVAIGTYNSASSDSIAQGVSNRALYRSFAQGYNNSACGTSLAQGQANMASSNNAFAQGSYNKANYNSFAQGYNNSANQYSFAQGSSNSAINTAFAWGVGNSADGIVAVFGRFNLQGNGGTGSAAFAIGDGTATGARHDLMLVTKDGEITMYSSTADTTGTGIMSSIRALSANAGGVDSATVSAIASSYVESGVSSKQDTLSFAYNTANQISSINGSALGGMDEAAVSGIASAYAESAASSKLDTTAFNSADFYSTANPSGFIDSAYVDSAVSGKADSSALSSYALSADVSSTVDLVSTQSANWGGSALALSAGPGVTLSKSGNTLTINTETVLWSGTPVTVAAATTGLTLAESPYNFDRVALYWVPWNYTVTSLEKQESVTEAKITSAMPRIGSVTEWNAEASDTMFIFVLNAYFDASKFYTEAIKYFAIGDWTVHTQGNDSYITKIVGINRTAEA